MLLVEHARWGQTPEDLRRLAMSAPHRRTRERFLALYDIVQGSRGATCIALRAGRHPQTVMGWLHTYNVHGPDALVYRRTGGRPPPCMGRSRSRRICRRCACARCSKDWAVASGGRRPAEPCIRSARIEPDPHPAFSAVIGPGGRDPSF